jgi:hypothetical protein
MSAWPAAPSPDAVIAALSLPFDSSLALDDVAVAAAAASDLGSSALVVAVGCASVLAGALDAPASLLAAAGAASPDAPAATAAGAASLVALVLVVVVVAAVDEVTSLAVVAVAAAAALSPPGVVAAAAAAAASPPGVAAPPAAAASAGFGSTAVTVCEARFESPGFGCSFVDTSSL